MQVEAVHCLTVMNGDLEQAAQLLITRAEMGQDIRPSQAQVPYHSQCFGSGSALERPRGSGLFLRASKLKNGPVPVPH